MALYSGVSVHASAFNKYPSYMNIFLVSDFVTFKKLGNLTSIRLSLGNMNVSLFQSIGTHTVSENWHITHIIIALIQHAVVSIPTHFYVQGISIV